MESNGSEEKDFAKLFAIKYCNLIDNYRENIPRYLSEDVILEWFGRTIAGRDQVASFIMQEVPTVHKLIYVEPSSPIQARRRPLPRWQRREDPLNEYARFMSCTGTIEQSDGAIDSKTIPVLKNQKLPFYRMGKKQPKTSTNATPFNCKSVTPITGRVEIGQGDSFPDQHIMFSTKMFLEARGSIEFTKSMQSPTSSINLKLAASTKKWERNIKLCIGYTCNKTLKDFEISLMIYSSNSLCRKNLSTAFSQMSENL